MAEGKSTKSPVPRSGIYMIRCVHNGRVYIGSAVYIKDRWSQHRAHLGRGTHYNSLLQRAWDKHSAEAFEWIVLEYVERERLIEREQHYIDLFNARDRLHGFNFCQARSPLGRPVSPETRAKIADAQRNLPPEVKARMAETSSRIFWQYALPAARAANLGATRSPESRARMAASQRGRKQSKETRAKRCKTIRNLPPEIRAKMLEHVDKLHSPESRAKAHAKARLPESRARAAEKQRGRKLSPETRAKMSEAHRNVSAETKAKRMECLMLGHSPEARAKAEKSKRNSFSAQHKSKDLPKTTLETTESKEKKTQSWFNF